MKEYRSFSSNINQVITVVLNSLFFLQKDFARTKSTKKHQKHQKAPKISKKHQKNQKHRKAPKAPKSTKTQPSKSTKQFKRTKIKNVLKKHLSGKSNLFASVRFSAFYAREKKEKRKKIEKREKSPQCNVLGSLSMQM